MKALLGGKAYPEFPLEYLTEKQADFFLTSFSLQYSRLKKVSVKRTCVFNMDYIVHFTGFCCDTFMPPAKCFKRSLSL